MRVSDDWKRAALKRMTELVPEVTQADLARAAKVSTAAIAQLFDLKAKKPRIQIRYKPQIHKELKWDPPSDDDRIAPLDELKAEIDALWGALDDEEKSHVLATARLITARKEKSS